VDCKELSWQAAERGSVEGVGRAWVWHLGGDAAPQHPVARLGEERAHVGGGHLLVQPARVQLEVRRRGHHEVAPHGDGVLKHATACGTTRL
jgi:hypothetical protein